MPLILSHHILRAIYGLAPFDLKGDWSSSVQEYKRGLFSCLILASRPEGLTDLLQDLSVQIIEGFQVEVIVIDDTPGQQIFSTVKQFQDRLNIVYEHNLTDHGALGRLRNRSLELSQGEWCLFLDDDTRLWQNDFLKQLSNIFTRSGADVVMPRAQTLYGIVKGRCDYLDEFSFATRCCAFRRTVLTELGGFQSDLNAYEDIELSIRLTIKDRLVCRTDQISYAHPPLYFDSLQKPLAIGQAIFQLRQKYSWPVWMLVYLNALRFVGLIPFKKFSQFGRISLGVLLYPLRRHQHTYQVPA